MLYGFISHSGGIMKDITSSLIWENPRKSLAMCSNQGERQRHVAKPIQVKRQDFIGFAGPVITEKITLNRILTAGPDRCRMPPRPQDPAGILRPRKTSRHVAHHAFRFAVVQCDNRKRHPDHRRRTPSIRTGFPVHRQDSRRIPVHGLDARTCEAGKGFEVTHGSDQTTGAPRRIRPTVSPLSASAMATAKTTFAPTVVVAFLAALSQYSLLPTAHA